MNAQNELKTDLIVRKYKYKTFISGPVSRFRKFEELENIACGHLPI